MIIDKLKLVNYRNYESLDLKFNSNINIFYGNNAQGKTNILESIYLISTANSHRLSENSQIIKNDCSKSKVTAFIKSSNFKNRFEIILSANEKILKNNGNDIKKISEYLYSSIDVIIFTPDDLDLIKGSPSGRRNFINNELCKLSENYTKILNDYNKILKIRNDYLKKLANNINIDESYFNIISNYLVDKGILIYRMRKKFFEKINDNANDIFIKIFGMENFKVKYICNFFDNEDEMKRCFQEKLEVNKKKEIQNGMTLFGPHRDDLEFYLNDKNLKDYGSQGQQRASVLCLKLSEIDIYKNTKFRNPVVLLDDIFSELDDIKKNNILKLLSDDIQVFITTTDLKNVNKRKLNKANYYKIKDGKIIKIEEEN